MFRLEISTRVRTEQPTGRFPSKDLLAQQDHNRDASARKGSEVREFGVLMGCGTSSLGAQCASSEYDIEIARTARGLYSDRQVDRLLGMAYSLNTRVARVEGRRLGQAA